MSVTELCVCRRVRVDSLDFDSFQGCVLRVCRVSLACSIVRGMRSPQLPTRQQTSGGVSVGVSRIGGRTSKMPVCCCMSSLWICDDCTFLNLSSCAGPEVDMSVRHDKPVMAKVECRPPCPVEHAR